MTEVGAMRRPIARLVLLSLGLLTFGVLLIPGRAAATPGLTIIHQPPAFAMAGANLEIDSVVATNCTFWCGPVDLAVHYVAPSGVVGSVSAEEYGVAHAFRLQIPADQLRAPSVSYWLEAQQTHCTWIGRCTVRVARAPATGTFVVPIQTMP
jgi:hypothetical protein